MTDTPAPALPPSLENARELVRSLVTLGVREVVLAPGSRSAPLAYALALAVRDDARLRLHVRVDERDAGFLALGLARAGLDGAGARPGRPAPPVAVVTTSGTAVVNLHPAVLEAHHAGVPLLLLTADRPHELRGTGANQTADQVDVFGHAVRLAVDVPAPSGRDGELRDLRAVASRAVAAASGTRSADPGPVHLNLAYRDPLAPSADGLARWVATDRSGHAPGTTTGLATVVPAAPPGDAVARDRAPVVTTGAPADVVALADEPATVVVAGDGAGRTARALAEARGWPLLAEASSGAAGGTALVAAHRLVLGVPEVAGRVRQVVVLGRPTLSRPVQALLAAPDVRVVVVEPARPQWVDASRTADVVLTGVPREWLDTDPGAAGGAWAATWAAASRAARAAVDEHLAGRSALDGLAVASAVVDASTPDDVLVLGSSNPVRDLDLAARWAEPPTVVANRGLAGIDGTVSTALGVALAVSRDVPGRTTRALLGDLTFLHDVGGLLRGPGEPQARLQLVVVNDDGGSIFATLEHGRLPDRELFERVFATPHGADLAHLCAGYGVPHERVDDARRLHDVLARPADGVSVVEVRVDRSTRHDGGLPLADAVRARVAAALRDVP
ncbi:2-succinyl-5-enolpyruvyl-6-hydroxy-3-cyclohexene-1-carboxylic-acid synthase [Sanguibacter suaedae]|uniref:2-succinyl-5-enolpyruvyl-6-hydroxy-3-cyclohexene-1-carboxylate synthase n=1 Tax=Sanguibacter suaedae TaxID=2795737 RepID=A0A934I683_9MICO|nr:2-succinyl-5-enolpyruvyl-6-hydroxy-3-cyclohexene-1-carboxylic-acid synthase [Sanguibacter suaedae]MBI9113957.1 2-succinyl-5-enolpyruvyl-6-hydroxy-3-cyclohexene-1-carboxylic-acid synthase [Sanguibacter suaedae]